MDEEEELQNTLIGQNPMMEEQPILNVEDNRLGGNAQEVLGLTGALAGIRTNPFLTGSMNQAASPSLNPATGPSGGTRLPSQPSLEQASRAASRTAGMGSYSGTTGELSRGKGFDLNSNRIGSSLASNVVKGATQGIIGAPSLFLNPNEMADATLSGANQRAAEQGAPLPFPDAPNAEALQLLKPSSAESEVEQKPGFFEPGGFGYENLGPRLVNTLGDIGERFGQFAGEQLYGTGITAEGQPTGFPVDRPTLAGDLLTLPGTALNVAGLVTDPLVTTAKGIETATEGTISGVKNLKDYVTGDTGVQAQQEASLANQGVMAGPEVAPTLPPAAQSFFGQAPASSASGAGQRLINAGNNAVESIPSLPEGVQANSPQANFLNRIRSGEALTQEEINAANTLAKNMGTTFDPETGYSRDPFLSSEASRTSTPLPGQTLSQFMRYEDSPSQRTEQFVDPQGRLRRRLTPQASALQGFSPGEQPLAPQYEGFEQASAISEQGIRDRAIREGESQSDRDSRIAQERTQGSTTDDGSISFEDARKQVARKQGERVSSYNDRIRAYMAQEKDRNVQRRLDEARIRAQEASTARDESKIGFEPRIVEVEGERTLELSPGYFQRLQKDTPEKTGLQKTIENLQADLKSGRLTQDQYDIATKNAKNLYIGLKQPKQNETDVSDRISELQNEAMGVTSAEGANKGDRPVINTQQEYDALRPGSKYIDSAGAFATKPE